MFVFCEGVRDGWREGWRDACGVESWSGQFVTFQGLREWKADHLLHEGADIRGTGLASDGIDILLHHLSRTVVRCLEGVDALPHIPLTQLHHSTQALLCGIHPNIFEVRVGSPKRAERGRDGKRARF